MRQRESGPEKMERIFGSPRQGRKKVGRARRRLACSWAPTNPPYQPNTPAPIIARSVPSGAAFPNCCAAAIAIFVRENGAESCTKRGRRFVQNSENSGSGNVEIRKTRNDLAGREGSGCRGISQAPEFHAPASLACCKLGFEERRERAFPFFNPHVSHLLHRRGNCGAFGALRVLADLARAGRPRGSGGFSRPSDGKAGGRRRDRRPGSAEGRITARGRAVAAARRRKGRESGSFQNSFFASSAPSRGQISCPRARD